MLVTFDVVETGLEFAGFAWLPWDIPRSWQSAYWVVHWLVPVSMPDTESRSPETKLGGPETELD